MATNTSYELNVLNDVFQDTDLSSDLAIQAAPALKLYSIKKEGGYTCHARFVAIGAMGIKRTLAAAQAQAALTPNIRYKSYAIPFGEYTGSIQVDWADIKRGEANENAAGSKILEDATTNGLARTGDEIARLLLGTPGQSLGNGTFNATGSGAYPNFAIRLADPADAKYFPKGRLINASTGANLDSSGSLVAGTAVVVSVDREVGYAVVADISTPDTPGTPGSWVDTTAYYYYNTEDFTDGDQSQTVLPVGAYISETNLTTNFHGLARGEDSAYSGAKLPVSEVKGTTLTRLQRLFARMANRYSKLDDKNQFRDQYYVVMNPEDYQECLLDTQAKVLLSPQEQTMEGFMGVKLNSVAGQVTIVSEPHKVKGNAFVLNKAKLELHTTTGKLVDWVRDGSGSIARLRETENKLELRPWAQLQHIMGAPYLHGIVSTLQVV